MFKKKYKECFDDIKGDKSLLESILENGDSIQQKRIPFKRIYSYAASCAAILVLASAVFLFNKGILKHDSNLTKKENTSSQSESISNEQKGTWVTASDTEKQADKIKNENITISKPPIQEKKISEAGKVEKSISMPLEESASADSQRFTSNTASIENYKADESNESLADSSNIQAKITGEPEHSEKKVSGGGGGSSAAAARFIHEAIPHIVETGSIIRIETGNKMENAEFSESNTLTVFDEAIEATPTISAYKNGVLSESYIGTDDKSVTVYSSKEVLTVTDGEKFYEVSLTIYKNDNSYSAYLKGDSYYFISAENISEEYMVKIVESLVNNN